MIKRLKRVLNGLSSLTRRKLRFVGVNIPVVFILIAGLSIFPIGMAFGEGDTEPAGRNLLDPENPLIEIYHVGFYPGTPADEEPPIPNLRYPDSTPIKNGDFWLSFNWRMLELEGSVEFGDYFDVVLSTYSLHHFNETEKLLIYKKVFQSMKPGGLYIEGDKTAKTEEQQLFHFAELERLKKEHNLYDGNFYHYDTPLTVENQVKLLESAGFGDIKVVWHLENETMGEIIVTAKKL